MSPSAWIALAGLALTMLAQIVGVVIWAMTFHGKVQERFAIVHERKEAMLKRIASLEDAVKDMRSEIRQTIKEGLAELKAELHTFHQLLDRKADKPH